MNAYKIPADATVVIEHNNEVYFFKPLEGEIVDAGPAGHEKPKSLTWVDDLGFSYVDISGEIQVN
jgi:hypothetical protein